MRLRGAVPVAQGGREGPVQTSPVPRRPADAGPLGGQADRERDDARVPGELEPAVAGRPAGPARREKGLWRDPVAGRCGRAGQEAEWRAVGPCGRRVGPLYRCDFVVLAVVGFEQVGRRE